MPATDDTDIRTLYYVAAEFAVRSADLQAARDVLQAVSARVSVLGLADPELLGLLQLPSDPEQRTRSQEIAIRRRRIILSEMLSSHSPLTAGVGRPPEST
jgi:hypothetical protein